MSYSTLISANTVQQYEFHIRVFAPENQKVPLEEWCKNKMFWKPHNIHHMAPKPYFVMVREGDHYDSTTKRQVRGHFHIILRSIGALVKGEPNLEKTHKELRESFKSTFPSFVGNGSYSIAKVKNDNLLSYILKTIPREDICSAAGEARDPMPKNLTYYGISVLTLASTPLWTTRKKHFNHEIVDNLVHWYERVKYDDPTFHYNNTCIQAKYYIDACLEILRYCREKERWIPRSYYAKICLQAEVISPYAYLAITQIF